MFGNRCIFVTLSIVLVLVLQYASAQEPFFNYPHGLYNSGFELQISSSDATAPIYYTTDGSDPRRSGMLYEYPIDISESKVLRAATLLSDTLWSDVTTASYIFPKSLLSQGNAPQGYPTKWGTYCQISGTAPADYEMDPEMTSDPVLQSQILKGITTLPIISLVTDKDNLFNRERDEEMGGIYIYTGCPVGDGTGRGWERPVSFEFIGGPDGSDLTVDCCLKLHGGHGRLPEKNPKHAFRLHFKSSYGPGKLKYRVFGTRGPKSFNSLVLRTFFGYSWQHWDNAQRSKAQYCRDMWARYTQAHMGDPISLAQYAHLFINGMYWGMYNMCERVTDDFCKQKFGGEAEYWDVTEVDGGAGNYHAAIADYGNLDAWNQMADYIYSLPDNHSNYLHLIGLDSNGKPSPQYPPLLDIDNYIHFMLINLYGANTDWDHHNWYAYRNRVSNDCGFRFICWDTENIFVSPTENLTSKNNRGCPTGFMNRLMKERLFAHHFHQVAQKHLFHGGALTPEAAINTWDSLYNTIAFALYDESARWGDYRRDVHPYSTKGTLYTVNGTYQTERNRLLTSYFPNRTTTFIKQLRDRGWFPKAEAPEFFIDGRNIGYDIYDISMVNAFTISGDEVYYTTDGTDPVIWDTKSSGTLSSSAILCAGDEDILLGADWFTLPDTLVVKAISRTAGEWSPIVTTRLKVEHPTKEYEFYASEPVVRRGSRAELKLSCRNAKPILTWQFDVMLPEGLAIAKDDSNQLIYSVSQDRTTTDNHTISFGRLYGGSYRFTCRQTKGIPFSGNDGVVASIMLQADGAYPAALHTFELRNLKLTDTEGETHSIGSCTVSVSVRDAVRGDVNGDGAITTSDMMAMVHHMLDLPVDTFRAEAADVNGDGDIDGADIVRLVSAILGTRDLDN